MHGLRRALLLLLLAAMPLASLLVAPVEASPPLQEDAVQQLADKYAPIVFLRNQDGECDRDGQLYEPRPVEILFDEPGIVLKNASGAVVADPFDTSDLYEKDDGYFIDLPGSPKDPGCTYERDYRRLRDGVAVVTYARIARQSDHEGFALQYWFLYYFNDWNNRHESDWEMIQLIFDVDTPEAALNALPVETGYSQHSSGESADWDSDKVRKDGDHPHVYVATGAGSNFYRDRTYLGRAEQGAGFGCDDASGPSRSVAPQVRVMPPEINGADDEFAWATFEGRWGERQSGQFNGPTGPNTKRAWDEPFGWQEDLRETSVEVPISREIEVGVNVASMFCDIVAFASNNLLVAYMSSPWVVVGAGLVIVGAAGATFTRTRYRPVLPEPLRQRRALGQVMSSATRIYARYPMTMLALGLAFIPAAIISSLVQIALAVVPFIGPVYDIFMRSTLSQFAVVIGVGAFFATMAFAIVMAGVARVMHDLDVGVPPGTVDAYRAIWRHLSGVLLTRLRAAVIVTLFGITIVGLPWAINRLVRWLFAEWAIVAEGRPRGSEALDASSDTVDGHWWRTFGYAAVVMAIGLGLGPTIGLALLFVTDWPLATVNTIGSVLYLALVPWTGVALSMLYYDLKARGPKAVGNDSDRR